MAKVVSNATACVAVKFVQRYKNNGVPRKLRCDQAQTLAFTLPKQSLGEHGPFCVF